MLSGPPVKSNGTFHDCDIVRRLKKEFYNFYDKLYFQFNKKPSAISWAAYIHL